MFKVPKSVDALLKSCVCPKKLFPYGHNGETTFYDPGCVEDMYVCRDYCVKKCNCICEQMAHEGECGRGKLPVD